MKFLFRVRLQEGYTAEQYAAAWIAASRIIQAAPGARGTRLHRRVGDPAQLLAIAEWDSVAARDAAATLEDPEVRRILAEAGRFCEIEVLGEFEDAEWTVLPGDEPPAGPTQPR